MSEMMHSHVSYGVYVNVLRYQPTEPSHISDQLEWDSLLEIQLNLKLARGSKLF